MAAKTVSEKVKSAPKELARRGLESLLPAGKLGELILLGACAALGAVVYFLLSALLRLEEMELARAFLRRKP